MAAFTGHQPAQLRPWSPHGTVIALQSRHGIGVFDAHQPTEGVRYLMEGNAYVLWSHDGQWIACLIRSMDPQSDRQLVVVTPVAGGDRDTLFDGQGAWPWVWACDGNIYYWDEQHSRHVILPPKAWQGQRRQELAARGVILGMSAGRLRLFTACPDLREESLPALDSLAGSESVLVYDEFTDGKRFLIHGPGAYSHPGAGFVVDDRGATLDSLGWDVAWTSVSSDGQYVVGQQTLDDGHTILSSKLFLGDAHGRWKRPIPGTDGALNARFSREGMFISYEQRDSLKIGRLTH